MRHIDQQSARHLLMRVGLGFVLSWFGVNELRNSSEWAVFVPPFVADHSPLAVNDLIAVHGFLLVVAAAFVALGLLYVLGCLLAMGLILEILFGLWLDAGFSDLVIRDLGVFTLATALAIDPVRFWHIDGLLSSFPFGPKMALGPRFVGNTLRPSMTSLNRTIGGALAVTAVVALAFILRATGTDGVTLADGSVAALSSARSGAVTPSSSAAPAPSGQASNAIRFDDWKYKRYAFQVYPGTVSDDAKKALAGFNLSVQDQGSSALVSLKALNPRYRDAQLAVKRGQTAYFIETSMRDDPNDQENNLNDDGIIAVDAQGFVVPRQ